ncbi:MAG: hypothetical protein CVU91_04130 [Firmicutes bacterium HGW-Firmicutes-16]|nr:MAG: hypothetical protein CVU91_04130 [Firmicutes bacterium HGW-Firmicutes-16]
MAITKIFAIREGLKKSVQYAANEQKTTLDGAIAYAINPDKTEQRLFESTLNCGSVKTAYDDMQATKERYGKTDGVLGYHFIQSFRPGEITPEKAHELGVEFADRLFGNRFEAVIGTHLDKQHLHNHVVINSVSFEDGKKLRCNIQTYFKEVQHVSDELCRENGLSVIVPKGHGKQYQQWKAEKEDKPTIRGQLQNDIDGLISQSLNFTTFLDALRKNGYTVKYGNVKHTAIKPPYSERFIRLDSLGENYTDTAISDRIQTMKSWNRKHLPEPKKLYHYNGNFKNTSKITGLRALYFHYVYLLRGATKGTGNKKVSRYLLEDTVKFDRYLAQHKFLVKKQIENTSELHIMKESLEKEIAFQISVRKPLYKVRANAEDKEECKAVSKKIEELTGSLKNLRSDMRMCGQIEADLDKIREKISQVIELEKGSEPKKSKEREKTRGLAI